MFRARIPSTLLLCFVAGATGLRGQTPDPDKLVLGPGDRVRVEVPGDTLLSGDFDVDATGMVLVPVAGLTLVAGRPFGDVRRAILDGFALELVDFPVRVTPLTRVSVLGEVRAPGLFWADATMTLTDVLAGAGGLSDAASTGDVRLLRGGATIVLAADSVPLPALLHGDRVVVGRRGFVGRNSGLLLGASASVFAAVLTALIIR